MKYNKNNKILTMVLVLLVMCLSAVNLSFAAGQDADEEAAKEMAEIDARAGKALREGRPVLLYFYSDVIEDSRDAIPALKKASDKASAELIEIEAMKAVVLRQSYAVNYAPTVFLIRPEAGLTDTWIVDIPVNEIALSLKTAGTPNAPEKQIGEAIKKEKPYLVFFTSQWCGYCNALTPEIIRFQKDYSDCVETVTVDADRIQRMQMPYLANGLPTVLLAGSNGLLFLRTGYPHGYDRYVEVFEAMGVEMKTCKAGEKESGKKS